MPPLGAAGMPTGTAAGTPPAAGRRNAASSGRRNAASNGPPECRQQRPPECRRGEPPECRRWEPPECRRWEPPECRRGEPPECRRGEPPECRRGEPPECRRGEPPECRRRDTAGRGRDIGARTGKVTLDTFVADIVNHIEAEEQGKASSFPRRLRPRSAFPRTIHRRIGSKSARSCHSVNGHYPPDETGHGAGGTRLRTRETTSQNSFSIPASKKVAKPAEFQAVQKSKRISVRR